MQDTQFQGHLIPFSKVNIYLVYVTAIYIHPRCYLHFEGVRDRWTVEIAERIALTVSEFRAIQVPQPDRIHGFGPCSKQRCSRASPRQQRLRLQYSKWGLHDESKHKRSVSTSVLRSSVGGHLPPLSILELWTVGNAVAQT